MTSSPSSGVELLSEEVQGQPQAGHPGLVPVLRAMLRTGDDSMPPKGGCTAPWRGAFGNVGRVLVVFTMSRVRLAFSTKLQGCCSSFSAQDSVGW